MNRVAWVGSLLVLLAGCRTVEPQAPPKIVIEEVAPAKGKVVIDTSMEVRYYPITITHIEKMSFASEDMVAKSEIKSEAIAEETDSDREWKRLFAEFDVTWPEGSSAREIAVLSQLRARRVRQ